MALIRVRLDVVAVPAVSIRPPPCEVPPDHHNRWLKAVSKGQHSHPVRHDTMLATSNHQHSEGGSTATLPSHRHYIAYTPSRRSIVASTTFRLLLIASQPPAHPSSTRPPFSKPSSPPLRATTKFLAAPTKNSSHTQSAPPTATLLALSTPPPNG